MEDLVYSFLEQPIAGAILVLIGLVSAFFSGRSKAHDFHVKNKSWRLSGGGRTSVTLVLLGCLHLAFVAFNNDMGSDTANTVAAVVILVFPITSALLIRHLSYRHYRKKYLSRGGGIVGIVSDYPTNSKPQTAIDYNSGQLSSQNTVQTNTSYRSCGVCGAKQNYEGSRFCDACGTNI